MAKAKIGNHGSPYSSNVNVCFPLHHENIFEILLNYNRIFFYLKLNG